MYDRLYHIDFGWNPKRKRCDRNANANLDIIGEVGLFFSIHHGVVPTM